MRTKILILFALMVSSAAITSAQIPTNIPTGRKFHIQSAINYGKNNGGYWDIPGIFQPNSSVPQNSNVQVFDLDVHHDRLFTLWNSSVDGYYEIQVGYTENSRIDIAGANFKLTPNGANVQTFNRTNLTNQQFLFHHLGNGRFKIYDRCSGKIITLANRSSDNRSNVHVWDNHSGAWTEWYLIDASSKRPYIPPVTGDRPSSTPTPHVKPNSNQQSPTGSSSALQPYSLSSNEEFVYGKVGLNDKGEVRYTFAMTRIPNANKQIYRREMDMPYGPQPLIGGGQMRKENNPKDYDMYDYFVVFNGQKIGPYDRIYDIHQNNGDVDNWITPDGKHISFAGVKGQKYYPVFGNKENWASFWSVMQAPSYDPTSSKTTYTMQWAKDDSRLIENGSIKHRGWKDLREVRYSENEKNLLYVGAQNEKNKNYIYLNHEQIDGPYYLATQIGFLPGTNKPFYKAFNHIIVDNTSKTTHGVRIGDRKFDFTDDQNIGNLEISDPWVSFTVGTKNTDYSGNDMYKKSNVEIWEYNYRTDELRKHSGFAHAAGILKAGNSIYYRTYDAEGNSIVVAHGGKILDKFSASKKGENGFSVSLLSPNGDIFTYYKSGNDALYHLLKNGEPYTIQGVDKIKGVEILKFCPGTGKVNLVVNKDQSVASEDRIVINGDFQFNIKGRALANRMFFAEQGNDVITIFEFKRGDDRDFTMQIYRNNKPISDLLFNSVVQLCISSDASRYAALVTQEKYDVFMGQYFTENHFMHNKRKLLVDGKIVEGNFGAPVWSKAKNKFLVLKQEGNQVKVVEL